MKHSVSANYYAYSSWQSSGGGSVNSGSDLIPNTKYAKFKDFFGMGLIIFMVSAPILGAAIGGGAQIIDGPILDTINYNDYITGMPTTYIKETSKVGVGAFLGLLSGISAGIVSGIGLAITEISISIYKKSTDIISEQSYKNNENLASSKHSKLKP